jgi:signal transduction histidine kinase
MRGSDTRRSTSARDRRCWILLGWLLAGRALRPLRTMSFRARRITEENLHERLSADAGEDELGELANTFDGVLARLEHAFEAQKRFVANASHELRTPVTLEQALLEIALADPDADAETLRRTCERVLASTRQQQQMIEALLALARSQGGTDVEAPVDLADLAQDAITLRERRLDDITLATDLHPAPLTGDPALLERLVANLIDNAIIHNLVEDAWITVETGNEEAGSWLRVSNSGPEVPESMISEIFEPFRRMDGERTATAAGLGLGLSIVRAIADLHGAAVEAGPVEGGGLRVEMRF